MSLTPLLRPASIAILLSAAAMTAGPAAQARPPLGIDTARVTLAGTSNIHEYTASTTTVRVTRVAIGSTIPADAFWDEVVKPGALAGFEIAIPAASLSSPKAGLDKNMHKALKVEQFPEITFRLTRLESATAGAVKAIGALALAAYVVTGTGNEWPAYIVDVALLILTTNLFNLLDLRGGRVEKAMLLLLAGICLFGWTIQPIELLGIFVGPFVVGMALTLRNRAMLGDTGSNLAGAIAGVWLLTELDETGRLIALAVVLGVTIYGEFRSISGFIDRFPPLRFIDSVGRVK